MKEWNFSVEGVRPKMVNSLFQGESELYQVIEQDVIHTYKLITSSRYVTNRHLEQISIDAKKRIEKINSEQPWLYLLAYIRGVYSLSVRADSFHEYERRFSHFFQAMVEALIDLQIHESRDYRLFLEKVLFLTAYDAEAPEAPWPQLLFRMVGHMQTEHIDPVYTFLSESIDARSCSRSLALVYSYVSLLAGKEVTALAILSKNGAPYQEQEVSQHFELLKERARWRTMKQWLSVLFPQKHGRYGSLQPFIDEMNTALPSRTEDQESIWNRWLLSPNYQRFLTYIRHLTLEDQQELVERLLPQLEKRLHHLETAKTYEKLLLQYKKYELSMRYFLKYEREPLRLRPEKEELLQALHKHAPTLARPVYHQFIVRLVEKKSRPHYEQAATYLNVLQSLYDSVEERALFSEYVKKLKKMYRTYRAFVEELKRIDL